MARKHDGVLLKTSLDGSPPKTMLSGVSWEHLWEHLPHSLHPAEGGGEVRVWSMDRSVVPPGESWTRRGSSRSGEGAFSWSAHGLELGEIPLTCFSKPKPKVGSILQTDGVLDRYFLTAKACGGILARAARRGKQLPVLIMTALEAVRDGRAIKVWRAVKTEMYRVHAAFSTAMMGGGNAIDVGQVDIARCLDTSGGFATNQDGNIILYTQEAPPIEITLEHDPLIFDLNQITSVLNYSNPKPGDAVHPLTHYGLPPHVIVVQSNRQPEVLAFSYKRDGGDAGEVSPTLVAAGHVGSHANAGAPPAVCYSIGEAIYQEAQFGLKRYETAGTLRAGRIPEHQLVAVGAPVECDSRPMVLKVRRLTPLECLRLQGFPDNFFDVPGPGKRPLSEGARYRMSGNSWAVPVVSWVFGRIDQADRDL